MSTRHVSSTSQASAEAAGPLMAAPDCDAVRRPGVIVWVFGVILPAFVAAFEAISGFCAALSFDPMPTSWHLALVGLVPVVNAWTCVALHRRDLRHLRALAWLNGAAAGVSLGYAVVLLPLAPLAVLALAVAGMGLLALAPALAFFATLSLGTRLRRMAAARQPEIALPAAWKGLAASLAALLLLAAPGTITFVGVKQAIRRPADGAAVRFLRNYGSRNGLLRLCYAADRPLAPLQLIRAALQPFGAQQVFPGLAPIDADQARVVFYRVTGRPYNAVEPPPVLGLRGRSIGPVFDASEMDWDQGGSAVAGRIRGLELEQSAMQGTIEGAAGLGYVEWTLTFRNDSALQREARAQVALPPGGVVSRLTLWIDGQEREAAYSECGQVRAAYERVVRARRDPVLVSASGKDRVMIQCFPVPPHGGIMKTKVGITAPLALRSHGEGLLRLPFFVERNFGLSRESRHTLSLKSEAALAFRGHPGVRPAAAADGRSLQGALPAAAVESPLAVRIGRPADVVHAWTEEPVGGGIVKQFVTERPPAPVSNLIVVLDGSQGMAAHREAVAHRIEDLPERLRFSVILAGDRATELCPIQQASPENRRRAAQRIRGVAFAGGCDNIPALRDALSAGRALPDDAVAWLHAAQPVGLSDAQRLARDWSATPGAPMVYEVALEPGPDVVAGALRETSFVRPVPSFGYPEDDLRYAFGLLSGTAGGLAFERRRVESEAGDGIHASTHLARLWANGEIVRLADTGAASDRKKAVQLAAAYRLVTPVSAAVVLETEQQYKDAGLEPVEPGSVPSVAAVPEPGTWALLAIGAAVMVLAQLRRAMRKRRTVRA